MLFSVLVLWSIVAILMVVSEKRLAGSIRRAFGEVAESAPTLLVRMILALLTAGFLSQLIPEDTVASVIGGESGFQGILIASLFGAVVPGGPIISFPIVVLLYNSGAGEPQLTAFLTAWAIFGLHRMIGYEIPLMGWRFCGIRLASSLAAPVVAGLTASALIGVATQIHAVIYQTY